MKQLNKLDIDLNEIKSFDVKEYVLKIISHWKLFLAMLFLGLLLAFFVNRYKQRIYRLDSVITVKEEQNPLFTSNTNISFNWGGPSDKVETIITILKSRTHNEKVVRELKYYINYLQEGRFRMVDVYGETPFMINLDTTTYQILGVPIELAFGENNQVTVSA
ncbi:MAG: sugar transporter, partial [Flavobacteriaceae bacterium]|nr:sugar transporter [Flavobacteriaceae bacterium]